MFKIKFLTINRKNWVTQDNCNMFNVHCTIKSIFTWKEEVCMCPGYKGSGSISSLFILLDMELYRLDVLNLGGTKEFRLVIDLSSFL